MPKAIKWKCKYCEKEFDDFRQCYRHESMCDDNPSGESKAYVCQMKKGDILFSCEKDMYMTTKDVCNALGLPPKCISPNRKEQSDG